jgi:hypothetical protein
MRSGRFLFAAFRRCERLLKFCFRRFFRGNRGFRGGSVSVVVSDDSVEERGRYGLELASPEDKLVSLPFVGDLSDCCTGRVRLRGFGGVEVVGETDRCLFEPVGGAVVPMVVAVLLVGAGELGLELVREGVGARGDLALSVVRCSLFARFGELNEGDSDGDIDRGLFGHSCSVEVPLNGVNGRVAAFIAYVGRGAGSSTTSGLNRFVAGDAQGPDSMGGSRGGGVGGGCLEGLACEGEIEFSAAPFTDCELASPRRGVVIWGEWRRGLLRLEGTTCHSSSFGWGWSPSADALGGPGDPPPGLPSLSPFAMVDT